MATQIPSNEQLAPSTSRSSHQSTGNGAGKEDEISLLELFTFLAERRKNVFWTTGVFAVLAIVVSLILPNWYTATVTLLPPQQNSSLSAALASQLGNLSGLATLAGGWLGIKNANYL